MNKNDLRYIKTEELITDTYENMLKTGERSINVTKLCKTARINTSTFYAHYLDIEDLHVNLCKKRLTELLAAEPAMDLLYDDSATFVRALSSLITDNMAVLGPLFAERKGLMLDIVEENLMERYADENTPLAMQAKIRFCGGGAMRLLSGKDGISMTDEVIRLINKIMN